MRLKSLGLALALLGASQGPVFAGMPYPQKMTCPVGGEKFTHVGTMSYSTYGARPDGKPYGSWTFPIQLPECPGNRMVIFKSDFSKTQLETLTVLVASPEYRSIAGEARHYRAAWLARRIGMEDSEPWLLLQASWDADDDAPRKARYQRAFVTAADAMPRDPTVILWWVAQFRAVNAERELGDFSAATRRIADLRAARAIKLAAHPAENGRDDNGQRESLFDMLDKEALIIARQDRGSEPPELVTGQR